jgi:hypothetical protein
MTGPVGQIGVKCKELKPGKMMSCNFGKEHSLIFIKEQFAEDKKTILFIAYSALL